MRYWYFSLIWIVLFFSCTENKDEQNSYNQHTSIISVKGNSLNDLDFLGDILKDRQIIILGESSHGDGTTFEVKTAIIEELVNNHDFTTIAFEGGGFYEMYYMKQQLMEGADFKDEIMKSWYDIWSKSKQTEKLIEFLAKNQNINLLGIESQAGNIYWTHFPTIALELAGSNVFENIDFKLFENNFWTFYFYYFGGENQSAPYDPTLLFDYLSKLEQNILNQKDLKHQSVLLQAIKNIESFVKAMRLNSGTYEEQNSGINLRDSMMAENINWWLKQHPNEKIIIWTANFHAAKNLHLAEYKEGDDFYQMMKPLGERLYRKYGELVYSLAFASSEGQTARIYEEEPTPIALDSSCWESEISQQIEGDYAFINFEEMRKGIDEHTTFEAGLLGYNCKKGSWLHIFDGVFYIRKMNRSEKMDE